MHFKRLFKRTSVGLDPKIFNSNKWSAAVLQNWNPLEFRLPVQMQAGWIRFTFDSKPFAFQIFEQMQVCLVGRQLSVHMFGPLEFF